MVKVIDELRTPVAAPGTGHVSKGQPLTRIDGPAKVMGQARYAAEFASPDLAYGVVVNTAAAKGRIVAIHVDAALAVQGVLDVLTHERRPKMRSSGWFHKDMVAPGGKPFRPLYDERVTYSGQPIALVVATTFEAARHAAMLVRVEVAIEDHETSLRANLDKGHSPKGLKLGAKPPPKEKGAASAAWQNAPFSMQATAYAEAQHHNPMELFATTVVRDAKGRMVVHDKTQGSQNSRWYVSHALGISKSRLTVRNAYVGGAFGSGLRPNYALLLAVMASEFLDRSVRVVLTRQQMFTFGHRPETWQQLRLSCDAAGRLQSIEHDVLTETSRLEDYTEVVVNWSGQLYACENIRLTHKLVDLDRFTPMDMRAPGAAHGIHALEVAIDALASEVGMDPLEFRLLNYADVHPMEDKPFSSKALRECFALGAERFGWAERPSEPRAKKIGTEYVGWGMATGTWDALQMFARAKAVLSADGRLLVTSAASDIGTGTYTVMAQIAADAMGLPLEQVTFQLGDSTLPVAPIEGGSSHVTTVGSAIEGVCDKLREQLLKVAKQTHPDVFKGCKGEDIECVQGQLKRKDNGGSLPIGDLVALTREKKIEASHLLLPNQREQSKYARATHSAVFCEVRVDEALGTIRVTRVVSAIAAGRIINPMAARSQILGGVVWGISHALHEGTHDDPRLGRFMNHDFAEYHVAVSADIHEIDVLFADEDDRVVSRLGAKGVGEIGLIGVSAAIANAIHHAVGVRIYDTPITPDKVIAGLAHSGAI
jgi:xanthine dehydrogenase YagR molybdenum-binding subunit